MKHHNPFIHLQFEQARYNSKLAFPAKVATGNQCLTCHCSASVSLPQEREEAEALWAADGQSVVKKDEEKAEGGATPGRNARNQAPKERSKERGRVTGGKDEL